MFEALREEALQGASETIQPPHRTHPAIARARARRAAAASAALRDHALDVLESGVVVCDLRADDEPIVFVNRGFERLTGYTADEVLGLNCRFLQGPDTDPETIAAMRKAIDARERGTFVVRNYRKDGTAFWNEVKLSPFSDAGGRVTHFTAVQTDVTARVEAERRLRESESEFRLLLDSTGEAIYGLDTEGNCTFCNPACVRLLGYDTAEELVGRNMHDLIHARHADGSAHAREACLIYKAFSEGTETHCEEDVFWRCDGTSFPVAYWSYPIRRGDEVVGTVVNFSDLTERKHTARRLLERTRMLETINQINLALAGELELSRLVQQVTDAGRMLTGAEYGAFFYSLPGGDGDRYLLYALSGAAGSDFSTFPMPRSTELFRPTFERQEVVRVDDVLADRRNATPGTDGEQVPARSYLAVPVVARDGDVLGALLYGHGQPRRFDESHEQLLTGIAAQAAVAVDNARLYAAAQREIEERKEIERALSAARRAADQSNRSKTEFLANMSHEIRTPMTAILGYADILAAHLNNPDDRECIDVIKRNGRFLLDIVDDILDLSRIEAGRLRIEPQRFRLEELLADVRSLMEVRAQEKNLPLTVEYTGRIPDEIETDPTRLRQILINLIANAIKFTEKGSVRLVVSHLGDTDDTTTLRFDVIDSGIGIEACHLEKIFEPFSQVDTSMTRRYDGTGLGLAISQRLAGMLGGEIHVVSRPGAGSRFSVEICVPTVRGAELIVPNAEIVRARHTDARQRRSLSGRILVVDDRRDIRYLARHCLEEAGARVLSADNGRAALDIVAEQEKRGRPFDVILMDMQMPVLDGYAATRLLRERGFRNPIIALTAGAMAQDRARSLAAGCDAHVAKPIEAAALVNLVALYVDDVNLKELAAQRASRTHQPENEGSLTDKNQTKTILIVDDAVDAAEALTRLLEMCGHDVRYSTTGGEALEAAASCSPDVVILDLGLPDLDGYAVAQRLRDDEATARCMLIALSGREADPERLRAAGFEHHFLKPADLDALMGVIAGTHPGPGVARGAS